MKRLLLIGVLLVACKGPEGPMGPAGPQGIPGPVGPVGQTGAGTRLQVTGVINTDGLGFAQLPSAAGSLSNLPVVACYLRFTTAGGTLYWVVVGDPIDSPDSWCDVFQTSSTSTALTVRIGDATPGRTFAIVVVY